MLQPGSELFHSPTPRRATAAWRELLGRPADVVAPRLLGTHLRSRDGIRVRIVEVEAYTGPGDDEASHAFRGPTSRNAAMFGEPGHIYVYLSYGIHHCVNLVAHEPGRAGGVLVRAAEVSAGTTLARARRGRGPDHLLAAGPGRFGQVVGATLADSGSSLFGGGLLTFENAPGPPLTAARGPRIGVSRAAERHWRWWLADSRSVSGPRAARAAPPPPTGSGGPAAG